MKIASLFLALILISACQNTTTIRKNKEFAQVFPQYKTVAIVPSYIFINKNTGDETKIIRPNPERINDVIQTAQDELAKKGYTVTKIHSSDESDEHLDFNDAYRKSVQNLYKGPESSKLENAYATEEKISLEGGLFKKSDADLLLILGYEGSEASQGEAALGFAKDVGLSLIGVPSNTHTKDGTAIISLIERKSGTVLWSNLGLDFETVDGVLINMVTKNSVMKTAFEKAFKEIPDKNTAVN